MKKISLTKKEAKLIYDLLENPLISLYDECDFKNKNQVKRIEKRGLLLESISKKMFGVF